MSSKRQMTMAKMMREQAVRERRARKQEKREARKRAAAGLPPDGQSPDVATEAGEQAEGGVADDANNVSSAERPSAITSDA